MQTSPQVNGRRLVGCRTSAVTLVFACFCVCQAGCSPDTSEEAIQTIVVDDTESLRALEGVERLENTGLSIEGEAIVNLAPLSELREIVNGFLGVSGTQLQSLDGLSQLKRVDGIVISDNALLSDAQLPGLVNVHAYYMFERNPVLESVRLSDGLAFTGTLRVEENAAVESIVGPGLETLHDLHVLRNPALTALDFPELAALGSSEIQDNGSLSDEEVAELDPALAAY